MILPMRFIVGTADGMIMFENLVSADLIARYLEDINHLMRNFGDDEIRGGQMSRRDLESLPDNTMGIKVNQMKFFPRCFAV